MGRSLNCRYFHLGRWLEVCYDDDRRHMEEVVDVTGRSQWILNSFSVSLKSFARAFLSLEVDALQSDFE